jgi:hypothetical protein
MSKPSHKKRPLVEVVTNEPGFHPDATLGPDASLDSTALTWRERESTNAPTVGEEEPQGPYASGYPELLEKFLQHRVPLSGRTVAVVIILAWFAFISWLFLQDNQAGSLATSEGLKWFAVKAGLYTGLTATCGLIVAVALKLIGPSKKAA